MELAARTWKHQLNAAFYGVTLRRCEFRSFASSSAAANHSYVRILGFLNRRSWVRIPPPSLFSFFELRVTPGFTQRGVLVSIRDGVVSAIPARCCDDGRSRRQLSIAPRNAPISKVRSAPPVFQPRTL